MKGVTLPGPILDEMKAHARECYPDECCGFLIGVASQTEAPEERTILGVERAANDFDGERRRRFLIRPEELRDADRRAESSGRAIVGFYHSHPDHPARPSEFDREHAWPWYSYVVLGVTAVDVAAVGVFELDAGSSAFHEVPLRVLPQREAAPSMTGR